MLRFSCIELLLRVEGSTSEDMVIKAAWGSGPASVIELYANFHVPFSGHNYHGRPYLSGPYEGFCIHPALSALESNGAPPVTHAECIEVTLALRIQCVPITTPREVRWGVSGVAMTITYRLFVLLPCHHGYLR